MTCAGMNHSRIRYNFSMPSNDDQIIRHALETAKEYGFQFLKLKVGDINFKATIQPEPGFIKQSEQELETNQEQNTIEIKANLVGYYKDLEQPLKIGQKVKKGELLATIMALGLKHDVQSSADGEIIEIFTHDGQPVEYNQILIEIKPDS